MGGTLLNLVSGLPYSIVNNIYYIPYSDLK